MEVDRERPRRLALDDSDRVALNIAPAHPAHVPDALGRVVEQVDREPDPLFLAGQGGVQYLLRPRFMATHWNGLARADRVSRREIGRASCRERVCQYV